MTDALQIEIILGVIAFIGATYLGVMVILKDHRSWTHRLFAVLIAIIDAYIVVNFLSLHPPLATPENQLFWIRIVMFVTSLVGPVLVVLVHTFPNEKITMPRRYLALLFALMTASALASLTDLIFQDITYPGGEPLPIPGSGMFLFVIDFVGLFVLSFVLLLVKFLRATGPVKIQLGYFFWGTLLSFSLMSISTVIFILIFKTSALIFLGPVYPVILSAAIAYAIVKHQMFNIKVIATQAIVIVIDIILFAKIFGAANNGEFIIDAGIFLAVFFLGLFLIRSVNKEVRSREQLLSMTKNLEKANNRLKELDTLKSEFLSLATHQMRSPLTAIKGYISLIEEESYGPVPKEMTEVIARIREATNNMVKIINIFLNVSRIEQGQINYDFQRHDVRALVEEVLAQEQVIFEKNNLTLHVDIDETQTYQSNIDIEQMRQVVSNLIDNAVAYTPEGSITVKLGRDTDMITFSVTDTGVGMSEADQSRLFQRFSRASDANRTNVKGTGLGLYVARKIIDAHKGRIWATSEGKGKGSTFAFELNAK